MFDLSIMGIEFYDIFYCFFIYCFCGWIWECCYCSVSEGRLINRGFLSGPIIPIYGSAGTLILLAFFNNWVYPIVSRKGFVPVLLIFFGGALVASALEYITSYSMEKLFHAKWWDYSEFPLNLNGRICLFVSLFWGAMSLFLVKVLHPGVLQIIGLIPRREGEMIACLILVLFLIDFVSTVWVTAKLDRKLIMVALVKKELVSLSGNVRDKEVSAKIAFKERYGMTAVGDVVEHSFDRIDAMVAFYMQALKEAKDSISDRFDATISKIDSLLHKNKRNMDRLKTNSLNKYDELTDDIKETVGRFSSLFKGFSGYTAKRLARAFPNMKFVGAKKEIASEVRLEILGKDVNMEFEQKESEASEHENA